MYNICKNYRTETAISNKTGSTLSFLQKVSFQNEFSIN